MSLYTRLVILGLAVLVLPVLGAAQTVTPVGVTVSSTYSSYDEVHLIDNSGLAGGLHDTTYSHQWIADQDDVQPWLVFDLGAQYDLTSALIWQYSVTGLENRGVDGLDILTSTDGVNFTLATSTNLAIASGGDLPAQTVSFTATGRYVRFEVTSNHGDSSYTGLAEVKFEGLPSTVTPVGVTVSSTYSSYDEVHLIDNSGLAGGLHDTTFYHQWIADQDDVQPWLVFDLGAQYDLTSALIWQYSVTGLENRGVDGLDILTSTDGVNFTLATSTNLAIASGGDLPAQTVSFTATGRYVRFEVTSNHGDSSYTGLAEVKFEGLPSTGADLAVTKTFDVSGTVFPGDQITYAIGVINNGPGDATGVVVTDPLPAQVTYVSDTCGGNETGGTWTWAIGALANGASTTCDVVTEVVPGANGPVENTAGVAGNEPDPTPTNDSATASATASNKVPGIPVLGQTGAGLLVLLLAAGGLFILMRRTV